MGLFHNKRVHLVSASLLIALMALMISYVSTNLSIPVSGEKLTLKYWSAFTDWVFSGKERLPSDDVVFINVANDKQLVEVSDEFGIPIGNAAVTDRCKLNSLMELIQSSGTYKYVLLDVFFEDGYHTTTDSALFASIDKMDRIVIARHTDRLLDPNAPSSKAAYADYYTSISETDFSKYRLFYKDGPSIPLRMYSDLTGRTVRRRGVWYADGSALSRKVVFPKMFVRMDSPYRYDGQKAYLNLGKDILDYTEENWPEFFSDKIIVVGAFSGDDIHTTYAGDLPGSLVNYNVFLTLLKGKHKIPVSLIIVYFLIFFAMSYLLLRGGSGSPQPWAWVWAKLFALYSAILIIVCIFVFMIWGQAHDIFITSTFFSIVDLANRRIKAKK